MCGIAGVFGSSLQAEGIEAVLRRMTDSVAHRGPDNEGLWLASNIGAGLGFRRLSILDLETGNQPLLNEDETIAVVCNGEIYNHLELRRGLEKAGHRFRTRSDCEVIVHLYEERGEACLHELNGMFALAVLDARRRLLLLARDAVGMKHLYVARRGAQLAFASEARALFSGGVADPSPNWTSIATCLCYGLVPAPQTAFQGVERLPPGHYLLRTPKGCVEEAFWRPRFPNTVRRTSVAEEAFELEEKLRGAVKSHLAADVPVGVFVSGGLDSSLVAVFAAQLTSSPLRTFSIVFPDNPQMDERVYSRAIARQIGSEHEEVEFRRDDLAEYLPAVVRAQEEPIICSPAPLLYSLSKLASRRLKVVLTGEGSDELFAGYPWLKGNYTYCLRQALPRAMAERLADRVTNERLNRLFRIAAAPNLPAADAEWFRVARIPAFCRLLNPDLPLSQLMDVKPVQAPSATLDSCQDTLQRRLSLDFTRRLPDGILFNMDKVSMASSLEARMPFLDRGVVDFALSLPSSLKLRGRQEKALLNRLAHHLPPQVANRRKHGLRIPALTHNDSRFRTFSRDVLLGGASSAVLFHRSEMEKWLADYDSVPQWRRKPLWSLLNLKLWWDEFVEPG